MAQRWPQDGPQMVPTWPQDGPRWPGVVQDGPKVAQDGPEGPKMDPTWLQHRPKMSTGRLQDGFKRANTVAPRWLYLITPFSIAVGVVREFGNGVLIEGVFLKGPFEGSLSRPLYMGF